MTAPSLRRFACLVLLPFLGCAAPLLAADPPVQPAPAAGAPVDLEHQKTLYLAGYAHLDTQWRWAYPQVMREFIRKTMEDNFPLLDKYPHYVFNFTGSRRYE